MALRAERQPKTKSDCGSCSLRIRRVRRADVAMSDRAPLAHDARDGVIRVPESSHAGPHSPRDTRWIRRPRPDARTRRFLGPRRGRGARGTFAARDRASQLSQVGNVPGSACAGDDAPLAVHEGDGSRLAPIGERLEQELNGFFGLRQAAFRSSSHHESPAYGRTRPVAQFCATVVPRAPAISG